MQCVIIGGLVWKTSDYFSIDVKCTGHIQDMWSNDLKDRLIISFILLYTKNLHMHSIMTWLIDDNEIHSSPTITIELEKMYKIGRAHV